MCKTAFHARIWIPGSLMPAAVAVLCVLGPTQNHALAGEPKHDGIPPGYKLIEGDILVPINPRPDGTYATNLWPNGVIPFEFDSDVTATNRQNMLNAMAEWENVANVHFVP